MRKKLALSFAGVATAFALSTASVSAGLIVNFEPESGSVVLKGSGAGNMIVRIVKSDADTSKLSSANMPAAFDEFYADGDFTYELMLPPGTDPGEYAVYIDGNGISENDKFSFFDVPNAETNIIPYINKALEDKDFDSFAKLTAESAAQLGIDTEDSVYKNKKDSIFKLMYACNSKFDSAADFYNEYYRMHAVMSVYGATRTEIEEVMQRNEAVLGIDYNADYSNDKRLTDKARTQLCTILADCDYEDEFTSGNTFAKILSDSKAVAAARAAESAQELSEIMENTFGDEFEFIFRENSQRDSLSSLTAVYSQMMDDKDDFYTMDDIQDSFDDGVRLVVGKSQNRPGGSGSSGGSGGSSGKTSFVTVPSDPVAPTPLPGTGNVSLQMFGDVSAKHWAYTAITELAKLGAVNGYKDGSFNPDGYTNRAEFVKLLVSLGGYGLKAADFEDVASDAWYNNYVGAAADSGIILGSDGKFFPESNITRQDAALILYRIIEKSNNADLSGKKTFADSDSISDYAKEAVESLGFMGILNGYEDDTFRPVGNITRAEMCQIIYNSRAYIIK